MVFNQAPCSNRKRAGQLSFIKNYVKSANAGIRETRLLILGNQRLKMVNTSGHAAMK